MKYVLIYFAIKYKGDFDKIYNAIRNNERVDFNEIESIKKQLEKQEFKAITLLDSDYPDELKEINKPPMVLFYKGDLKILKMNKICFTGFLDNSSKIDISKQINQACEQISIQHALVSNLYKGVDEQIVNEIQKQNAYLILVSANGLENPYFAKTNFNKEKTLILSEYPPKVTISKKKLIQRNRLVAGLAESLVIVASKTYCGIMNLVSYFLENGKEIYCYPEHEQNDNDGNYLLLKEGATLVTKIVSENSLN